MALSRSKKILIIAAASVVLVLAVLHFWFSRNAARYLELIVAEQSRGRLQLKVKGFSFNLATGFIEIKKGTLRSLDSTTQPATYDIRLDKLTLHLQSFWPLLIERRLLLDSIAVDQPQITIYRWRKDPELAAQRNAVSLPSEMGRLYRSLLDGLDALELKHIQVRKADLRLYDRMQAGSTPVTLHDIDFDLRYPAGLSGSRESRTAAANARLNIPAQQIALPGAPLGLAFKQLRLEQFGSRLQLDSCTIRTTDTAGKRSSIHLFFDRILLSGMDFNALYRYNLIRADSVFCERPVFRLNVTARKQNKTKDPQQAPGEIMSKVAHDLGADLDLAFIGVRDAGFNIRLTGRKSRSISNARNDDFSVRGLRINADSSQPFTVAAFDLMVRGYELYNEDSSAVFRFDSVQLRNNRIVLRQFTATTLPGKVNHNIRRYSIPYFELENIDWYALVFEDQLRARNAYLNSPNIFFQNRKPLKTRQKESLFDVLASVAEMLSLEAIHVRNGQLHLIPNSNTDIRLENADLVLQTTALLAARNETGVKNSVRALAFGSGTVRVGDATIGLRGVRYDETRGLQVATLDLNNNNLTATFRNVVLGDALISRSENSFVLRGLQWQQATLRMTLAAKANKGGGTSLLLEDLNGRNTELDVTGTNTRLRAYINLLSATAIRRTPGHISNVEGLRVQGSRLEVQLPQGRVQLAGFSLVNDGRFELLRPSVQQETATDTLHLNMAAATGRLSIPEALQQQVRIDELTLRTPHIYLRKHTVARSAGNASPTNIRLGSLTLLQPSADIVLHGKGNATRLQLPAHAQSVVRANGLHLGDAITLGQLRAQLGPLTLFQNNGTRLGTENGSLFLAASDLRQVKGDQPGWTGTIDSVHLTRPYSLTVGKKGARLNISEAGAGNISLPRGGAGLESLWQLPTAWLRTGTGTYRDSNTVMYWEAARYDARNQRLSLDSFAMEPAVTREAFIATRAYQADYITFRSGPLRLNGFDRKRFEQEQFLSARTIQVQRPVITLYRDKRPPFLEGILKPLPTDALKRLSLPLDIGQVQFSNGLVAYTELNSRTNEEGIITLTHLNATISNIRNQNIKENDSLQVRMEALLLDSARISLQLKESYTDSLAGFVMQLKMRPTSLSFLNPVVAPLSSVQIVSGTVDSLYLNAIGREYMALGEMHLFYRNLKVKLVQVGEQKKPKVLLAALSFLANNLVIRTNNKGRKSLMYFERLRDRSVFNYLVKMTMSGIASGVGVKKNKKALRKYHKELERLQVPHFSNEAILEEMFDEEKR